MLTRTYRCFDCQKVADFTWPDRQAFIDSAGPQCRSCGSTKLTPSVAVPFNPLAFQAKANFDSKYPYVSSALPRNLKGCRVNAQGKPVIESKAHERNIMAGSAGNERYERD